MPLHNQISIWCQGGLWFGLFSFVNTTCQFSLLFTCRVTLAQAWNVILHRAHLSLPTWKTGRNNLRSPKSEGAVMHYTEHRHWQLIISCQVLLWVTWDGWLLWPLWQFVSFSFATHFHSYFGCFIVCQFPFKCRIRPSFLLCGCALLD